MTAITWNAEGGSDGTNISTANSGGSSGTAWDTCQRGTNATNEYDSAQAANGTYSALIATGGTSTSAYNRWSTALTSLWASGLTTHYGRFYFRLGALPASNRTICEFLDTGVATNRANFLLLTTGAIRLRNAANGTVVTFTTTVSVDTWYRLEYRIDGSTTGAYEIHLFAGNNASAIESIVGGTSNFGGTIGAAAYGYVSNAANQPSLWFDGININDVALPGPETAGSTTVAMAQASETGTANAFGKLKTKALAQTSETDTANAFGKSKAKAIGQDTETETANAFGVLKTLALGQVSETDTANAMGRVKTIALGQATETDTANAFGKTKILAIGQASETDTANAFSDADQRNLQLVVGKPQTKWRAGPPTTKWKAGAPGTKWRAGSPRT